MLPLVLIIATERRARGPAAARGACIRLLRPRAMPTSSKGEAGVATPLPMLPTTAGFPPWKGKRKAWAVCAAASRVVAPARRRNLFFLVVVVVMVLDMEAHCCLLRCRPMQVVLVLLTVRVWYEGGGEVCCECKATGA